MAAAAPVVVCRSRSSTSATAWTGLLKQARQEAHRRDITGECSAGWQIQWKPFARAWSRKPNAIHDLCSISTSASLNCSSAPMKQRRSAKSRKNCLQEINDYLEAFQTKVDRIAGYWRWQESIAAICAEEAERLSARKRAAERRVNRLKEMLLAFMMSRGLKKLEGEKAAIGLQANSMPSLVIDDPLQIGECFFEKSLRFTKTELQEIVYQLADGQLRQQAGGRVGGVRLGDRRFRRAVRDHQRFQHLRSEAGERQSCAPAVTATQTQDRLT